MHMYVGMHCTYEMIVIAVVIGFLAFGKQDLLTVQGVSLVSICHGHLCNSVKLFEVLYSLTTPGIPENHTCTVCVSVIV